MLCLGASIGEWRAVIVLLEDTVEVAFISEPPFTGNRLDGGVGLVQLTGCATEAIADRKLAEADPHEFVECPDKDVATGLAEARGLPVGDQASL